MEVRAKKALGQHFLTVLSIAQRIAEALIVPCPGIPAADVMPALEVGPGMGVLTQYLLQREEVDLRMVEIDTESVDYLLVHFPQVNGRLTCTLRSEKGKGSGKRNRRDDEVGRTRMLSNRPWCFHD